jgi:hypothetical protein
VLASIYLCCGDGSVLLLGCVVGGAEGAVGGVSCSFDFVLVLI